MARKQASNGALHHDVYEKQASDRDLIKTPEIAVAAPVVDTPVLTDAVGGVADPAPPAPEPLRPTWPPLNDFIKQMERDTQEKYGLAITKISHPEAEDGVIFQGTYAGIPLIKGEPGMLLSDGQGFGSLERRN